MSAAMAQRFHELPEILPPVRPDAAFLRMDDRLVQWGQIMLRGAMSSIGPSNGVMPLTERSAALKAVVWSGAEQAAAMELHSRVIRLPEVRQRLVLQVHYKAREAAYWYELTDEDQSGVEAEMCREGLARMRQYAADNPSAGLVLILRQTEFRTVRIAAVRALIAKYPLDGR